MALAGDLGGNHVVSPIHLRYFLVTKVLCFIQAQAVVKCDGDATGSARGSHRSRECSQRERSKPMYGMEGF